MPMKNKPTCMSVTAGISRANKQELDQLISDGVPTAVFRMLFVAAEHMKAHFLRWKDEDKRFTACKYVLDLMKDETFLKCMEILQANVKKNEVDWGGKKGKK